MALEIKIRGPNKTSATLTQEQFDASERLIVAMMNREMTVKAAESAIIAKCEEIGDPLDFA